MRLFRTIAGAHGGRVFANMGEAFGISDELTAQAVRYFLPPIIKSITRQTETSQGLLQFLEFLGTRRFDRYMDDPTIFDHTHVEEHGRVILAALFPRGQQIRKIVNNRAKVLPITPQMLDSMFPYVAVLAFGSIEQKTRQPLGIILKRIASGRVDAQGLNNPYSALAREIRYRKVAAAPRKDQRRAGALTGMFGAFFARGDARSAA